MDVAKELGINLYDSFEAILKNEKVDAVVISVPNNNHKELVIKTLNAGKNVICEKPVEMSVAAFDEVTLKQYRVPRPESNVHDFYRNFCLALDGKADIMVNHVYEKYAPQKF